MKYKFSPWYLLLASILACGCAELIEIGDYTFPSDVDVSISRHEVDIMVGDELTIDPLVQPDSLMPRYYWYLADSIDADKLKFSGNKVSALSVGDVLVYLHAELSGPGFYQEYRDSCFVHVFEWPEEVPPSDYANYMVLNCQINIDGQSASQDNIEIAAVASDGEVRGRVQWLEHEGVKYAYLRIYSDQPKGDTIFLQCYDHAKVRRIELSPSPMIFDGETHGSLSNLLQLSGTYN